MSNVATPIRRTPWLALVAVVLLVEVTLAIAMLLGPRPGPYGWQMYSGVPQRPEAFAVTGGRPETIDVTNWLAHPRVEIDHASVLRAHGCERTGADAIRIEHADGSSEEVVCR